MTTLDAYWARPRETLTAHTLAVVQQVDALRALRPLPQYPRLWERLRCAAYLHDSGKLAQGFQRGLRATKDRWGLRHEALSLGFVDWLDVPDADRLPIIAAIATHHRDASWLIDTYRPSSERSTQLLSTLDPKAARLWYDWLAAQGLILHPFHMPTASAIDDALRQLDRWLEPLREQGAQGDRFAEGVLLRGYLQQADHRAAAGVSQSSAQLDPAALQQMLLPAPYPHQQQAAQHSGVSAILLAPTGAGKTEAALLWGSQQRVPRLFYSLPYRASMNAMQKRLMRLSPHVGLQHGRALHALYYRLLSEQYTPTDALTEAKHRMQLARLMAYPIRIFSPYHLLRAAYQLKGFEMLLADMQDAALVIDEIHAYDPQRLALILGTLALLMRRFNTRLLLMTATLPPIVAQAIDRTLGTLPIIRADAATYQRFTRHRLHTRTGDLFDALDDITAQADTCATLITVNTVRRARALSHLLRQRGHTVLVLHGRYNGRDRLRLEAELMRCFGAQRPAPPYPIVVATQVIEVSLDVDFDRLYSDPAPLDALLQRFGRVNRRRRLTELAPVTVFEHPTGADDRVPVYNPTLVQASYAVLQAHEGQAIDEARVTDWLRAAYTPVEPQWWTDFEAKATEFSEIVLSMIQPFESADSGLTALFNSLFDECLVLPLDLEDEYERLKAENPVEADALLVSLSWWQYKMLERNGTAWPNEDEKNKALYYYTSMPYDSESGLQLEQDNES